MQVGQDETSGSRAGTRGPVDRAWVIVPQKLSLESIATARVYRPTTRAAQTLPQRVRLLAGTPRGRDRAASLRHTATGPGPPDLRSRRLRLTT